MEARSIRRPVIDLLSGRSSSLLCLNAAPARHESSYRRTRSRLNIGPDSSFLPSKDAPRGTHIIFNPPSSQASVFHTPLKFLPPTDPRRRLFSSPSSSVTRLPPALDKKAGTPIHHLSEEQMREIQKLRMQDPVKWTTAKLARKYGCTTLFVTVLSKAIEKEKGNKRELWLREKERKDRALEAVKARWGPRRRMAREDREKRQELALRDE